MFSAVERKEGLREEVGFEPNFNETVYYCENESVTTDVVSNLPYEINELDFPSYKICFFSILEENVDLCMSIRSRRNLLSEEEAAFETQNILVKFHKPVFTLPEAGTSK